VQKLRAALRTTLEDPETIAGLKKGGVEEIFSIPVERLGEAMRAENQKWGELIRRANITMDS
jgi:hypothetical protein